ncbi:hypothetical protein, partial [Escherichia coli]|uniref:hypothetical protein n=1 Tax=Escherichia coli TaxID=562 RepID=UPI003CE52CF6
KFQLAIFLGPSALADHGGGPVRLPGLCYEPGQPLQAELHCKMVRMVWIFVSPLVLFFIDHHSDYSHFAISYYCIQFLEH